MALVVMFCVVLLLYIPVAISCCAYPAGALDALGAFVFVVAVILIDDKAGAVIGRLKNPLTSP